MGFNSWTRRSQGYKGLLPSKKREGGFEPRKGGTKSIEGPPRVRGREDSNPGIECRREPDPQAKKE